MSTTKSQYWQIIRGICILAVILIHCASEVSYPWNGIDAHWYFIARNLINFPVAVFFFMSGRFCKEGKVLTKHRLCYLIIPYFVYSTIYIFTRMIFETTYTFVEIVKMYVFATAAAPLYYIWVLVYYTLLTPFLWKYLCKIWLGIVIGCVSFVPLLIGYICEFNGLFVWDYLKYTTIWLPFYYAGMLYQKKAVKIKEKKYAFLCLICAFTLQLVESYFMLRAQKYAIAYSQMRVSGIIYASAVILFLCSIEKEPINTRISKGFIAIGNNSYGIYYLHSLFLLFLSKMVLNRVSFSLVIVRPIELIFSLSMSLFTIYIIRLIFKKRLSKFIFGV